MAWRKILDDKGRNINALVAAHHRSIQASNELIIACERSVAAGEGVIREIDRLPITELFELHAQGK